MYSPKKIILISADQKRVGARAGHKSHYRNTNEEKNFHCHFPLLYEMPSCLSCMPGHLVPARHILSSPTVLTSDRMWA